MIYTVQGFRIVNEAEVDVFLEFPCFFSELATRPGAECGSNHQLLIAKFRLKLERAEKTTRPRRYNLNQISCNYTVEVMNRFKRLVLVNTVPEELRTEVCNVV